MANESADKIISFLQENKADFYEKYGIYSIALFGSFSRKEQTENSDIDIAIEMLKEKKTLHNFLAFKRQLEKEFDRKIDLGIESALKPRVRTAIEEEMIYV